MKSSSENYVIFSGIKDKISFVFVKRSVTKRKALVYFEPLCCKIDMPKFMLFMKANCSMPVGAVEKVMKTYFIFFTTVESFKRILKAVFELIFSKIICSKPYK